ncbi:NAD(P)H-hydrate dehydratase [Bordetella sp. 02P26C-1]|uniref:NAD(P)H-hydrate dehydratase n=1 Tax=Bordetella sp. 02P26C-1 TaxID=2683195 RepID=UPI001355AED0|nr:NAD(P)H-hydrate dehydratase [Bordetella sp. 02P26C-1]MVW78555.1 NAD(P)H-hydrate dehydratase [Bordetella sp. 02P26C-1]
MFDASPTEPPLAATADIHPTAIRPQELPALFAKRPTDSHKGTFGTVAIVGGGPGMVGAVLLAGRAALKSGAGKVLVGFASAECPVPYDAMQPELMLRAATALFDGSVPIDVWVAGCGLGTTAQAKQTLQTLLSVRGNSPLVLDADGLNQLATGQLHGWESGPLILTPHPAEAARLLGCTPREIQANRQHAARALANRFGAWVVLKGAGSLVCEPSGRCWINHSGNPGLATAGTGDVLAGLLGSLLAQDVPLEQAVPGAVWLHGAAADKLVAAGTGPIGLTAGELADAIRELRNHHG